MLYVGNALRLRVYNNTACTLFKTGILLIIEKLKSFSFINLLTILLNITNKLKEKIYKIINDEILYEI